jgi:hypothetical protein
LQQSSGEVAGFSEEEKADLRDVRAGGDVDQVILAFRVELAVASKLVECRVDFFEIPRIAKID